MREEEEEKKTYATYKSFNFFLAIQLQNIHISMLPSRMILSMLYLIEQLKHQSFFIYFDPSESFALKKCIFRW